VVVVSTAIKRDNPELTAARARRIPVVRRAEMLAELMRSSNASPSPAPTARQRQTSLVATLLDAGASTRPSSTAASSTPMAPTRNWAPATGWWSRPTRATALPQAARRRRHRHQHRSEHLDHFVTFDAIKEAFLAFVENLPFYGFAVMCLDHPTVQELVGRIEDRRVVT